MGGNTATRVQQAPYNRSRSQTQPGQVHQWLHMYLRCRKRWHLTVLLWQLLEGSNSTLSVDHIEKTTIKYDEKVGYSIPQWMARFKSIPTTGESGHLFSYDDYDIWPGVCVSAIVISQMRNAQGATSAVPETPTDGGEDSETNNDGDKRPRTASSQSANEEGRGRAANSTVMRSPVQDFRERPQEPKEYGGRQFEERRNRQHHQVSNHGPHSDKEKSGHSVGNSQRALYRSAPLPRRAAHESRIHARLGEVHGIPQLTLHHGPLLPLRTMAGGLRELGSLQELPVQVTQGHDSHGRQDRDGCRQADHHHRPATMQGYAPKCMSERG